MRKVIIPICLVAIVMVAVGVRLVPMPRILQDGVVMFPGADEWAEMRLVDQTVLQGIQPYDNMAAFPDGKPVGYMPFMSTMIAKIALFITRDQPKAHTVDMVGAFFPVFASALVVLMVYLLAKRLFRHRWTALLSALLVAIMPTEFMGRSVFGAVDHHVLEVLFTLTTIYFLLQKGLVNNILAGLSLALLCLSWNGSPFFIGILLLWIVVEFVRTGIRYTRFMIMSGIATSVVALTLNLIHWQNTKELYFILGTFTISNVALWFLSRYSRTIRIIVLAVVIPLIAVISFIAHLNDMTIATNFWLNIKNIFWGWNTTIQETQPMTIWPYVTNFGLAGILWLVGLVLAIKKRRGTLLFAIWSVVMGLALIGQRRWGYYVVVPASIYASYAVFQVGKMFTARKKEKKVLAYEAK